MRSPNDLLKQAYALNQKWAVRKMVQSYESDEKLAYIHGFDAGIDLLCARAAWSDPAVAESIRELANALTEETARTLRSLRAHKEEIVVRLAFCRE